jgi:hypothetical protein
VAGCGSSANDDYKKQIKQAANELQKAVTPVEAQASSPNLSLKQRSDIEGKLQAGFTAFGDKLQKVKPPGNAKAEHARLVAVLRKISGDLGKLKVALGKGDVLQARTVQPTLITDQATFNSTLDDLKKKVGG